MMKDKDRETSDNQQESTSNSEREARKRGWMGRNTQQPSRLQYHQHKDRCRDVAEVCVSVLKPHQKEESHVRANLEVTSSHCSLIHFKVCPLKAKTQKQNKKKKTMTGSTAPPPPLPPLSLEKHSQKLSLTHAR